MLHSNDRLTTQPPAHLRASAQTAVVQLTSRVMLVAATAILPVFYLGSSRPRVTVPLCCIFILVAIVALRQARTQPKKAAALLCGTLTGTLSIGLATVGRLDSPLAMATFVAVVLSGVLLGARAAMLSGLATITAMTISSIGRAQGWLPRAEARSDLKNWTVNMIAALTVIALVVLGERLRSRLAAQAVKTEAQLEAVFEAHPFGVALVDHSGSLARVNQAFVALAGATSADELYKTHLDWLDAALRNRGNTAVEALSMTDLNGQQRTLRVTLVPFQLDDASAPATEVICQDITDQVRRDAEIERLAEQMRATSRMQALGSLAGGIAHDFNNLLSVVRGNAELLDETPASDSAPHWRAQILGAVDHGKMLTIKLLQASATQTSHRVLVPLAPAIEAASGLLTRLIREDHQLTFTTQVDSVAAVLVEEGAIEQIVVNLIINAAQASNPGDEIVVSVTHDHRDDALVLRVEDSGSGIEPENLDQLFDPFYSTRRADGGSGLGLSIVYALVEQSDGTVSIESTLGVGTEVTIRWPARQVRTPSPTDASLPASLGAPVDALAGLRVLVVEDYEPLRELTATVLAAHGAVVSAVPDGSVALERCAHVRFDALVSDVVMPGISGIELAEKVRQTNPHLRVVLMTGHSDELAAGSSASDGLLRKPWRNDQLVSQVASLFDVATETPGQPTSTEDAPNPIA